MTSPTETGGSAFPQTRDNATSVGSPRGMTLRDYFAGQALAGTLARDLQPAGFWNRLKALLGMAHTVRGLSKSSVAVRAYELADSMLAQRAEMEKEDG